MSAFVVRVTKLCTTKVDGQGVKIEDYFGPYWNQEDAEEFGEDFTRDDNTFYEVIPVNDRPA